MSLLFSRRLFSGVALVLAVGAALPAFAADDPAVMQIRSFYDVLLNCMKNAKSLGIQGRYSKLKPIVEQTFNLAAMTQFAVGPSWDKFSGADRKALTAAFERMTIASYAKNFDDYSGQSFVVDPTVQNRPPDRLVSSELHNGKDTVQFIYRMREYGGKWQVIDIFLAGFTSQLALRRSEFANTAQTQGAAALIKKINDVADGLMKG